MCQNPYLLRQNVVHDFANATMPNYPRVHLRTAHYPGVDIGYEQYQYLLPVLASNYIRA